MELMMHGMKTQFFSQLIPQTLIMSWISFFTSLGFIVVQLPIHRKYSVSKHVMSWLTAWTLYIFNPVSL
jgi:hypothetical protein